MTRLHLAPAVVAASLLSAVAVADVPKAQCIEANTRAQDLRRDGKLADARQQLRRCADPTCPAIVRDDCSKRLDEVERMQPTIVFAGKDAGGDDVIAVKVTIDGKPAAERLDGTEYSLDPGPHVFSFDTPGRAVVTKTLVLVAGEKGRREVIVFDGGPAATRASSSPTPRAGPPAPSESSRPSTGLGTQKVVALISGGLGVAGVAVGSAFGLMASSAWNAQRSDCASSADCPRHDQAVSDHSTMNTDGTLSTVGFVAGGVLLAAGAALFFTAPASTQSAAGRVRVTPSLAGREGAGLTVTGTF
jgi:hypothetical protein